MPYMLPITTKKFSWLVEGLELVYECKEYVKNSRDRGNE